jgi:hypothetical protein
VSHWDVWGGVGASDSWGETAWVAKNCGLALVHKRAPVRTLISFPNVIGGAFAKTNGAYQRPREGASEEGAGRVTIEPRRNERKAQTAHPPFENVRS